MEMRLKYTKPPRVLVSVLSYNSLEETAATIRSLHRQSYPNYDLQLVDNASAEGFIERMSELFPDLKIRKLEENLGYTGGNNLVLAQALAEGYDYVVIANHDIELEEGALEHAIETASCSVDAGLVGGIEVCYFTGETLLVERGKYSMWTSRVKNITSFQGRKANSYPISSVHGAWVLFTRKALEAGIRWDNNLFMYYDEVDMGIELEAKGLRAYVDTRIAVRHKNRLKWFNLRSGYFQQRNRVYIIKKHGRWYHYMFYLFYSSLVELPIKLAVRILQGRVGYAKACFLGHLDGVTGRMGKGRIAQF